MTANEFWDFVHSPENENRDFELIRGMILELYAERVGKGYVVTNDSGITLSEDPDAVVGPDVAFFTDVMSLMI